VTFTLDPDETALLERARAGDARAVEDLLRRHERRLFRFGLKMCGDPEDAGDVLQETLLAMAKNVRGFRGDSSIATWMYTIARSFCIKKRRRRKGAPEAFEPLRGEEPDARRTPEEEAMRRQQLAALDRAVSALPPPYREVLLLRDVEGMPASDVAKVLGVRVEAVKSRLHRARAALRDAVGRGAPPREGCPDVLRLLSRKLEGDVTPAACAEMERHLASCPRCEALCGSMRKTLALCRELPVPRVPVGVKRALRAPADRRQGAASSLDGKT
jgi:RNA polymerase sigma-70 factor, ECF subfamily